MDSKKNKWHDLRKNPEDMPPNAKHLGALCPRYDVMTKYGQTIGWFNPDRDAWFILVWLIYYDPKPQISMKMGDVPKVLKCDRNSNSVIAWREIDEYEEDVACM